MGCGTFSGAVDGATNTTQTIWWLYRWGSPLFPLCRMSVSSGVLELKQIHRVGIVGATAWSTVLFSVTPMVGSQLLYSFFPMSLSSSLRLLPLDQKTILRYIWHLVRCNSFPLKASAHSSLGLLGLIATERLPSCITFLVLLLSALLPPRYRRSTRIHNARFP